MEERGYTVIRCLGQGSQGRVYEVRDSAGQLRVIKQLPWGSEVNREDAEREMRLLSALRHPCIVPYLENFCMRSAPSLPADDLLCIVMSRCEGDLRAECRRRKIEQVPIEEPRVLSWLAQLCWGLQHLHSRKFLHRDLKPQNVLLTQSGRVLLADFGVACHLERTEDFRSTRVGTLAFMSPEMLEGKPYGRKTDQWALGCVLFEIMVLEPPFAGRAFHCFSEEVKEALGSRMPTERYGPALRTTLAALLACRPDDRPSNEELLRGPLLRGPFHHFVQSLEVAASAADVQGFAPNGPRSPTSSPARSQVSLRHCVTANMRDFLQNVMPVEGSPEAKVEVEGELGDLALMRVVRRQQQPSAVYEEADDEVSAASDLEHLLLQSSPVAYSSGGGSVCGLGRTTPPLGTSGWPIHSPDGDSSSILSGSGGEQEQTFQLGAAGLGAGEWRQLLDEAEDLLHPAPKATAVEEVERMRRALLKVLGTSAQVDKALDFLRERQPLGETEEADELLLQVELVDHIGDEALHALPLLERLLALEGSAPPPLLGSAGSSGQNQHLCVRLPSDQSVTKPRV